MSVCPGCGGIVGRDCFNPQECEWICRDIERRAYHEAAERDRERHEYEAHMERERDAYYAGLQMDEWVAGDLGPGALAASTQPKQHNGETQ